jgi:hypothetical protein
MLDELDVRHFKFVSGEEIVSCVINKNKEEYIIQLPLKVHVTTDNHKQQFYFTKWMPLADSDVCTINVTNIVSQSSVAEDMKFRYVTICNEYKSEASNKPDWLDDFDFESDLDDLDETSDYGDVVH